MKFLQRKRPSPEDTPDEVVSMINKCDEIESPPAKHSKSLKRFLGRKSAEEEDKKIIPSVSRADDPFIFNLPIELLIKIFKEASIKGYIQIKKVNNLSRDRKTLKLSFLNSLSCISFYQNESPKSAMVKYDRKYVLTSGQGLEEQVALRNLALTCKTFRRIIKSPELRDLKYNTAFYDNNLLCFQGRYPQNKYTTKKDIKKDEKKGKYQLEKMYISQLPMMLRLRLRHIALDRSIYEFWRINKLPGVFDFSCLGLCHVLEVVKLGIRMEKSEHRLLQKEHIFRNAQSTDRRVHLSVKNIKFYLGHSADGHIQLPNDEGPIFSLNGIMGLDHFIVEPIWSKSDNNFPYRVDDPVWTETAKKILEQEFRKLGRAFTWFTKTELCQFCHTRPKFGCVCR